MKTITDLSSRPVPNIMPLKVVLICPGERPGVMTLARKQPLVLAPFLGQCVLEHAIAFFVTRGAKEITLHANDRPEQIRTRVGNGELWGITVKVIAEDRELTETEAFHIHGAGKPHGHLPSPHEVFVLDRLPQLPEQLLWESYTGWFKTMLTLIPRTARERVGMRQIAPGVFVGLRSQIAASAKLTGPCWIGANVHLGERVVIGPGAVVDDGAYLDTAAEVIQSVIGPQTYVGELTEVRDSLGWGCELVNLRNGSRTEITDRFLLADLAASPRDRNQGWRARLAAALQVMAKWPLAVANRWSPSWVQTRNTLPLGNR